MKKVMFLFFASVLIFSSSVSAQSLRIHRGTMYTSGSITLSQDKMIPDNDDSVTGTTITVNPSLGYFLSNNFAVQGSLLFQNKSGDLYDNTPLFADLFGVGVGMRFMQPILTLYIFVDMSVAYTRIMPKNNNIQDDYNMMLMKARGGIMYPLTSRVALETGIDMTYVMNYGTEDTDYLQISMGYFGISAFF